MRWAIVFLILSTLLLQWPLWFGDGSWSEVMKLREVLQEQREENRILEERNRALEAEVLDLREGTEAVEERARRDLGMIREGELFFQLVPPQQGSGEPDPRPSGGGRDGNR